MISIAGLDRAKVLIALYSRSRAQGLGILHATNEKMSLEEANRLLEVQDSDDLHGRLDYVRGRVMKVRIAGDEIDERLYDRDNGPGAAAAAIDTVRRQ